MTKRAFAQDNSISRPARKPTLMPLLNVSTQTDPCRHILSQGYRVMIPETENPQEKFLSW